MDLISLKEKKSFWGREFLTWLWFKSEERNGTISVDDYGDLELIFENRMVLESGEDEYSENVICLGRHSRLKEAKRGVSLGKKVREARIKVNFQENEWVFTLKGDSFDFQSLKLPPIMSESKEGEEKEGRFWERIYLVEEVVKIMETLFKAFLELRCDEAWAQEVKRIRKWVAEGQ